MSPFDFFQLIFFFAILVMVSPLLGNFLARVFSGQPHLLSRPLGWLERLLYKFAGIAPDKEMSAGEYSRSLLYFNLIGFVLLMAMQLGQSFLPLNPKGFTAVPLWLALNTAVSFVTNTNWQAYSGETTMSYFVQSFGLTVQNFLSAATGMTVLLAVIRGLVRKNMQTIGNFYSDLIRSIVYVLLPLSILLAVGLTSQGVVQTWKPYPQAVPLTGETQTIPLGPAASQVAIKQLGTNGGGFFSANSSHPFENPTPLSNFLQMLAILLLPSSLVFMFGNMVGEKRQGWILWLAMLVLLFAGLALTLLHEFQPNPIIAAGPSLEGKELRFGVGNSALWAVLTTCASNGSVNMMHSSLSPIAGGMAMLNIMLGEVIFGGVGVGLTGMLVFVLITVFVAGLMIGRTPEYLGKKIEAFEIKMAMIAMLVPSAVILIGSAIAIMLPVGLAGRSIAGPHGLSEILYAFSSAGGNNGSAFAGLSVNTPFYNLTLALAMLLGRAAAILPLIAMTGQLANKQKIPTSAGTLATDTFLFMSLLIGIILIIGVLTFTPALCLGPILEQALVRMGIFF